MRTVAIIPARGGSKGVPRKNLRLVGGVPLIGRAVIACRATSAIDQTYVSTDDAEIATAARRFGAQVIERPEEIAGDTAGSESALLDALDQLAGRGIHPETIAFVQATSPFIDPADLSRGVDLVGSGAADSAFAAVESYEFLWREDGGRLVGQNHDAAHRPRRQDRRPDFRETGAFYVLEAEGFRRAGHRFFGRVQVVPVPARHAMEIDTPEDLDLACAMASVAEPVERPPVDVDLVLTDFDGVHTDDHVLTDSTGTEAVRVSRGDGLGVARLRAAGVPMMIISTEHNPVVSARGAKLGVEVLQGLDDKRATVGELLTRRGVDPARVAYLGNDVNDLGAMALVGWPIAVADARPEVRDHARLVLSAAGGEGVVRELCELVIAARRDSPAGGPDAGPAAAPAAGGSRPAPGATQAAAAEQPSLVAAAAVGPR